MSWALFLSTAQEVHVSDKQKDLVAKICGKIAPSSGPEGTFKNLQRSQQIAKNIVDSSGADASWLVDLLQPCFQSAFIVSSQEVETTEMAKILIGDNIAFAISLTHKLLSTRTETWEKNDGEFDKDDVKYFAAMLMRLNLITLSHLISAVFNRVTRCATSKLEPVDFVSEKVLSNVQTLALLMIGVCHSIETGPHDILMPCQHEELSFIRAIARDKRQDYSVETLSSDTPPELFPIQFLPSWRTEASVALADTLLQISPSTSAMARDLLVQVVELSRLQASRDSVKNEFSTNSALPSISSNSVESARFSSVSLALCRFAEQLPTSVSLDEEDAILREWLVVHSLWVALPDHSNHSDAMTPPASRVTLETRAVAAVASVCLSLSQRFSGSLPAAATACCSSSAAAGVAVGGGATGGGASTAGGASPAPPTAVALLLLWRLLTEYTQAASLLPFAPWLLPKLLNLCKALADEPWQALLSCRLAHSLIAASSVTALAKQSSHLMLEELNRQAAMRTPVQAWVQLTIALPFFWSCSPAVLQCQLSGLVSMSLAQLNSWHLPLQVTCLKILQVLIQRCPEGKDLIQAIYMNCDPKRPQCC